MQQQTFIKYISNDEHYTDVLWRSLKVKKRLWIGTANVKDLYIKNVTGAIPFLGTLSALIQRKVEVRLIYAKEPGTNFKSDFDKYPALKNGLEMTLCPRVHFKIIIFDMETAYIGSANLTGAGMGMKSEHTRNFEAGVLTNEPSLVKAAIEQIDNVWMGKFCGKCKRKAFCKDRIV